MQNESFGEMGMDGEQMPNVSSTLKATTFKDKLTEISCKQLAASSSFKKPRVAQWRRIDEMYNGAVKKRLRQMFQVPLPILSGMLDTLAASFDEPIEMEFFKKHPADYFKAKKTQAMWNMEKTSNTKNGRWDLKSRLDKKNALRYGRSIMKFFAESDPKYRSVLEVISPYYFHCQPKGGGQLENHLFCGQENVWKSEANIKDGVKEGIYDEKQFELLKSRGESVEYMRDLGGDHEEKMGRFRSLGLDPEKDSYVGERRYNLVEWFLTYNGKRWYILFDAWTRTWLRCVPLKEVYSKELYPYASWATHEDDQVFWSIGFGDILYPVADSMTVMFNQELTNREKKNFGSKLYDKDMITNVAAFDKMSYRADAIVEVDTKGGSRNIQEAMFLVPTAELQGTVQLIDWVSQTVGKETGITDTAQGAAMSPVKRVNVAFMEQAAVAKRIGYQSQSYTEAWGEIGTRYIQGLKDHMSKPQYIEILGEDGLEPDVLNREDLYTKNDLGVKVVSSTSQRADTNNKKEARIKAMTMVMQSQNINSEMRDAAILRDVGGYTESEIRSFFDTQNYAARDSVAKAHIAIQELLRDDTPDLNFAADVAFVKAIRDYAIEHRNKLGLSKFKDFMKYFDANMHFVMDNAKQKGAQRGQQNARRANLAASMGKRSGKRPVPAGRQPVKSPLQPGGGGMPVQPQQQPAPEQVQVS